MVATVAPPQTAAEFLDRVAKYVIKLSFRLAHRYGLDADDLVGDTSLTLLRVFPSYDPARGMPCTWTHAVVVSATRRHLAREKRHRRRFVPLAFDSDRLAVLTAATFARSAAKQRAAVLAWHWQGQTQLAIAERSGTTRQAVSALAKAAYRRLALALYHLT